MNPVANCIVFPNILKQQILCDLQGVIQLEKELANLGGVCAAALMKKDLALPIGESGQMLRCFLVLVFNFNSTHRMLLKISENRCL